jgi:glycosyltransferase involved in cell wall biosynthesis
MRALIITYYWPPSGGSSVLRWLKFTKYMREFDWEPIVYTPENPEPQEIDNSLLSDIKPNLEVITSRIWEPYNIYKWLTGRKREEHIGVAMMSDKRKPGFFSKLSLWIRSNLLIPDPRKFWIKPSVKLLSDYLVHHPADVVITTGPPHSMHLIGLGLKLKYNIKWIADFRDPWTKIDYYQDLPLTRMADYRHKYLENEVLHHADYIITVSPGMTNEFLSTGIKNVITITNGFDEEQGKTINPESGGFTILHLGSMPRSRNPENLWKVLSEMVKNYPIFASQLKISLIGKVDLRVKLSIKHFELDKYVIIEDFIPHDQTVRILSRATVLLLCINNTHNAKSILTNKFYEYLSVGRPILAFGPVDGDASVILSETGAGNIFEYDNTIGLKNHLLTLFEKYSQDDLKVESRNIERFSRRNLTHELCELLNRLIA